jgi:hypothetical protein
MKKIIAKYKYAGKDIGKYVQYNHLGDRELQTDISEFEAEDLLANMPIEDKIHIRTKALGVLRLAEHYGLNPNDYLSDTDLVTYVVDNGYKSLTDLNRSDRNAWALVRTRGLEIKLFPELKESDLRKMDYKIGE